MLKKFLFFILILFIGTINLCFAQVNTKITKISFDNSDNLVFLSAQSQGTAQITPQKIKIVTLEDPKRIYFDLPDTILTFPNNSWTLKNSKIKHIKVAQMTTNPNVVRVVMTSDEDLSKIFVMQVPSGFIIRYQANVAKNDYLSEFYRDISASKNDYLEKTTFIDENVVKAQLAEKDLVKQVDDSFNKISNAVTNTTTTAQKTPIPAQNLTISNNISRIKTKFYLNRIDIKRGNILISGIGSASFEKAKILTEPNRLVYDMPNTVLNPSLRNNEYKINETESIRFGQFEQSKVRIVITTNDVKKYKPIFSQDMQGILLAHDDRLTNIKLFDKTSTATSYDIKHTNDYDILTINFTEPLIQSIIRDYNKIELTVYNAKPIATTFFTNNIKTTLFKDLKIEKIASTDKFQAGQKIVITVDKYDTVYSYESQNGKQLVIKIEGQKVIEKKIKNPISTIKGKNNIIIIDPGHGGVDVGATRAGIYEKDINLDVSKKVVANLKQAGYKVEMTRTGDTNPTLQERCDFSNEKNSMIFVSIHANASVNESANGVETHYYHDYSINLANDVHKHLVAETKSADRGTIKSMFYVINHTTVPAILVEIGYISNEKERNALITENRKNQIAKAISDGIIEYLKGQK